MGYPVEQTWAIIRLNAGAMGWHALIANLNHNHFVAMFNEIAHPQYEMLHDFFEKGATPVERELMLRYGFQPRN